MTTGRRALGDLGVGPDAEDVYRILLTNPGSNTDELADLTSFSSTRLHSAIGELERLAMISRLSSMPARFQPAPPDVVVEALISSREKAHWRARLDVRELETLQRLSSDQIKVTEIVEILTSSEGVAQRWTQMQNAIHQSLEIFVRLPTAQRAPDEHETLQSDLIDRDVLVRSIYDREALSSPGVLEHVWRMAEAGEQAKVVTELPMKLALFDRQVGLVPLLREDPESTVSAGLVVHRSTLLDTLTALFDIYWERGIAVRPGVIPSPSGTGKATVDEVLTLMASGFKDEAIARKLDVSPKTVQRRVTEILRGLGVTTRFQAGLALGRQGQLDVGENMQLNRSEDSDPNADHL